MNLKPGIKKDFITKVHGLKSVKEARIVVGIYDAIIKIEGETIQELQKIYYNEIDKIEGILNSRLHLVACPRSRK